MTDHFRTLPNELIIEISRHVKPRHIVSFATLCKKFKLLGARELNKHQALKTTFQRVLQERQCAVHVSQLENIFYRILIRLDRVVISGADLPPELHLSTVFTAFPTVTSLEASGIVQEGTSREELDFPLKKGSSDIRNLNLESCIVPYPVLFYLIRSARCLQRFTYSQPENRQVDNRTDSWSTFDWLHPSLISHASMSLKELTLRCSSSMPNPRPPFYLKPFRSLRVLNIDFALLMGNMCHATDEMATILPASVKILNLYGCIVESLEWLLELVESLAGSKEEELPCLKELNFKDTHFKRLYNASHTGEVCEVARRAGIEMTIT